MIMPRPYISYSSYSLWKKDKNAFRRKYYEGEKGFETRETIFGKRIAEMLEQNHKDIKHIPRYEVSEKKLECVLDGVKVMGYLDFFDPEKLRFIEIKTGHLSKEGKVPWDNVKVAKHEQLVFYSLLIKENFKKVSNRCVLIWLETEFVKKTSTVFGMKVESESTELKLTGKMRKFNRTILEKERKQLKIKIKEVAEEIKQDYELYKKQQLLPN